MLPPISRKVRKSQLAIKTDVKRIKLIRFDITKTTEKGIPKQTPTNSTSEKR